MRQGDLYTFLKKQQQFLFLIKVRNNSKKGRVFDSFGRHSWTNVQTKDVILRFMKKDNRLIWYTERDIVLVVQIITWVSLRF